MCNVYISDLSRAPQSEAPAPDAGHGTLRSAPGAAPGDVADLDAGGTLRRAFAAERAARTGKRGWFFRTGGNGWVVWYNDVG